VLISILFTVLMLILCNTAGGAWIGVAIECSLSDKGIKRGVKVIGVDADGPGARTGLRVGDLVVLVNGETVETCSSLAKIVREASIGTCLKMIIWRKSEWVSIELILAARPQHFIFNQQGWEQTEKGNYEEAIRYFTKAIDLNPMDAEFYYNRGTAYLNKDQYDQAISDYKKALEINPMDAKAYYKRGLAYYYKKKYHKSWEDVNKAQILGLTIPKHILEKLYKALER